MAYQPEVPFPKGRGDPVRAADWNAAVSEVIRLEQAKLNQAGGTVAGNLVVSGNLSATGTISGRLAPNSVGNSQLTPDAVTGDKIRASSISVDRLFGFRDLYRASFTVGNRATIQVVLNRSFQATGFVNQVPANLYHPLAFLATNSGGSFTYSFRYDASESGSVVNGSHSVVITNLGTNTIQVYVTSFNLVLDPVDFLG